MADENTPTNEILNQNDIDALLMQGANEVTTLVYKPGGGKYADSKSISIEVYDFRNPVYLTENELRQVRLRHEKFVNSLAARLAMFFKMDFGLKMTKLHTLQYVKFTESIANPTCLSLFSVEDLKGIGIVDINTRLAMTFVNRMLGGKGHSVGEERYLSEIEMSLMDDAVAIILNEWCKQWEELKEPEVRLVGRENNGRFLQTASSNAIMLVLVMEATMGDCTQTIQLGVPYYMVEPIIKEMQAKSRQFNSIGAAEKKAQWMPAYSHIRIPAFAEWDAGEITVGDVLSLRPGDILELPKDIIEATMLRLKNTHQFSGEIGLENNKIAFRIKNKVTRD